MILQRYLEEIFFFFWGGGGGCNKDFSIKLYHDSSFALKISPTIVRLRMTTTSTNGLKRMFECMFAFEKTFKSYQWPNGWK